MPDIEGVPYEATGGKLDQSTAQALAARHREAASAGVGAASAAIAPVQAQVSALSSRVDSQDAKTLADAKAYTDQKVTGLATTAAMQAGDQKSLADAKAYTDQQVADFDSFVGVPIFRSQAEAVQWEDAHPGQDAYFIGAGGGMTPTDPSGPGTSTDVTGPAGAVVTTSGITPTGYTINVSGAYDEGSGLHATAPYAFSADGGATWSAYQAGTSYTVTGLTGATTYPAPKVRVRDGVGNLTTFTAASGVTTKSGVSYQEEVATPAALFAWNLDDDAGATTFKHTGTATHTSSLDLVISDTSKTTVAGAAGMAGYKQAPSTTGGQYTLSSYPTAGLDGATAISATGIIRPTAGTPYGAQVFNNGFIHLWIDTQRKLVGKVNIGKYYNEELFTVTSASALAADWASLNKVNVLHMVYDSGTLTLYHQGIQVAQGTYAGTRPSTVYIGGSSNSLRACGSLNGSLQGLRIWNTALDAAEVQRQAVAAGVA